MNYYIFQSFFKFSKYKSEYTENECFVVRLFKQKIFIIKINILNIIQFVLYSDLYFEYINLLRKSFFFSNGSKKLQFFKFKKHLNYKLTY